MSSQNNAAAEKTSELGPLPTWDLADLYPGRDSPALKSALDRAAGEAKAFADRYQGKLASLSGEALGGAIRDYERLRETLERVMSYASLVYAGDMSDAEIGRFYQMMQERVTDIGTTVLFFTLELNKLE
jgi:oligoendopeptidase F